ncbi:MAG TPA: GNAT family N-acetyltransferase [Dehalococcoidia bacterium]|nr:GNAT family N-acetyltransferase [Dehalococcoidia bacterium]
MKVELRSSFAGLESAWERLRARSQADHLFLSYPWQSTWWAIFGRPDALHLILVWDGDDLAGIAPLYREGTTLRFIGSADLTDYLDCLYRPDAAPILFEALGNHLAEAGQLDLDLCCLRGGSPTLAHLRRLEAGSGGLFQVRVEEDDVCPAVELPSDWETYLARLTKKDRHELRRKLRRLETGHTVRHDRIASIEALRAAWPDFFRLQALSRPEKAEFQTPLVREFFERVAEEIVPRGWLEMHCLAVDGVRVAAVICFAQGTELWLYNSGYDPAYRHLSVGLLLKALCLRQALESGKTRFDFLRGREPYKYDLGATDRPIYRARVARG